MQGEEKDGEAKGEERSKEMKGVMCCRGKSSGRMGVCDRERETNRKKERRKERKKEG